MTTSRRSQRSMFGDGYGGMERMWMTPKAGDAEFATPRTSNRTAEMSTHLGTQVLFSPSKIGFSRQATPASRSATPGSGPERMTPGISGRGFIDCLKDFRTTDRIGWFSRTFVGTSAWGSTVCSMTWKASATPRGRSLYLLRVSGRSTGGTGCGSSDAGLMQTPTVEDATRAGSVEWAERWDAGETPPTTHQRLRTQVLRQGMWPTPHASCSTGLGEHGTGGQNLQTAVDRMWPTPTVQDGTNTAGASQFDRNTPPLYSAVADKPGQKLNPDFVERLMGFPPGWTILSTCSDGDGSTACR